MDEDDFEDEFDIDFVNSASNKVKAEWAKTSIDKDLRDVTNTLNDDNLESKKKKKSKISDFIENASSDKPVSKTNNIDILNLEASDEEEVPSRKKETLTFLRRWSAQDWHMLVAWEYTSARCL